MKREVIPGGGAYRWQGLTFLCVRSPWAPPSRHPTVPGLLGVRIGRGRLQPVQVPVMVAHEFPHDLNQQLAVGHGHAPQQHPAVFQLHAHPVPQPQPAV